MINPITFLIKKIRNRRKTQRINLDDAAEFIVATAMDGLQTFIEEDLKEIASDAEIDFNSYDADRIDMILCQTCLWIAIKALEYDNPKVIQTIHSVFLEKIEAMQMDSNIIIQSTNRMFKKYNEAWDDNRGDQITLSFFVLSEIFNNGEPDKRFLDPLLPMKVTIFIYSTMDSVLHMRKAMKIEGL